MILVACYPYLSVHEIIIFQNDKLKKKSCIQSIVNRLFRDTSQSFSATAKQGYITYKLMRKDELNVK